MEQFFKNIEFSKVLKMEALVAFLHRKLFHSRKLRSYARGLLRGIPPYFYFS
ncbi:MAG: hypothetical protein DDT32_01962 [Syntrophomonadaceae bacterium]|nr:hypothetical protein [Bacillota bacterium]